MNAVAAVRGFRPRSFNRNVRSFYLYGLSINAGMTLYWLLYNLYLLRLSYQEDFIGQMASMAPLATALLALPTGVLSDRLGRRPFLIASGLLLALSQVGLCLSTASTALLAFSFVGGVANAFIWVNHVPFLSDNAHPSRRAEAIVVWSAVQIVVRMLLSLVGGFLPGAMAWFLGTSTELPEPFRYALFLGAACSLVSVVPLLRIRRQPDAAPVPERDPDEGEDPRRPRGVFAVVAVTAGMRGFSMGLTYPFFNVFFEEELHIGPAAIGAVFFLSHLVGLPFTFSVPALVRRFGATLTILASRAVSGGAVGIMGALVTLPVALPMFLLARAGEVIDIPADQHFTTQVLPRRYWARVQSIRVCGFQLLAFLGSLAGGVLILEHGYLLVFGLAALSRTASGLVMAAWFGMRPDRAAP